MKGRKVEIYNADSLEFLPRMDENSIDSCVTDPPYELGFMGKKWDSTGIAYNVDLWKAVLRVLKPGAHLLAFGGTRTYHRMACAIEDAGFEIRDQMQWLYGSGFPKSLDVSKAIDKVNGNAHKTETGEQASNPIKFGGRGRRDCLSCGKSRSCGIERGKGNTCQCKPEEVETPDAKKWQGFGTALKPANEPICVARKPLSEKTVAANVLKWGTGAINIDGCRVATSENLNGGAYSGGQRGEGDWKDSSGFKNDKLKGEFSQPPGRFPANIILDEEAGRILDGQSGITKSSDAKRTRGTLGSFGMPNDATQEYSDKGGASRFFYCAKASKVERGQGNRHPTVKPVKLMQYLICLVTPPWGTVLDPFMGSGTTGVAACGFSFIGIEKSEEYFNMALSRIR